MDKPVRVYNEVLSPTVVVGKRVALVTPDTPKDGATITSAVVSYDEITESIETENTIYVPAA